MEPPYSNHQAMRAEVVLRSIAPLAECPLIFSVGSFGVKTKDGRRFRFDWCQSRTDVNNDKEGRMVFVADLHGLTDAEPKDIQKYVLDVVKDYIALGLDPESCDIFIQIVI